MFADVDVAGIADDQVQIAVNEGVRHRAGNNMARDRNVKTWWRATLPPTLRQK
jgi:hypothetical protein